MLLMQGMGLQGVQLSGVSYTPCFSCKAWVCRECSCLVCPTLHASHARHGFAGSAAVWCVLHSMLLMQGMGLQGVQLSGVSYTPCFSCKAWVCRECSCLVCPTLHASHARHGFAGSAAVWCVLHSMLLMQGMGLQGVQLSGVSYTPCFSCKAWVCRECSCLVCPTLHDSHARHGFAGSAAVWCVLHFMILMQGMGMQLVCLFVGCLSSQQHASVSQGRICTDNFTCCHTEIEAADQTFYLTQSQYTDTGPTSPSADPITPGAWQGSHWSANV